MAHGGFALTTAQTTSWLLATCPSTAPVALRRYVTLDPEPRKELLGIFPERPVMAVFNGYLRFHFQIEHWGLPLYRCPARGFPIGTIPFRR